MLKNVSSPTPYISCILSAGQAKHRMTWAELSDAERSEARHIAHAQHCPLPEAAGIVRRSRR
jgi:hypothetical protein